MTLAQQRLMVERLAIALGAGGHPAACFETQISWVLVAGGHAYKIKKALRLPFLDYSTLRLRQHCCQEEYRLNRRLAPQLYLGVAPVTGGPDQPVFGGAGKPIDHAVHMAAFEQDALWSRRLASGALGGSETDAFAVHLARFHLAAAPAPAGLPWGAPRHVAHTVGATFRELDELVHGASARECLMALKKQEALRRRRLAGAFRRRRLHGMIRECHGDLHCGNVVDLDGQGTAFDGIEFSDGLRWIDVMDDLAFLHMDLAFRGRPDLAAGLLTGYLEQTGDYDGLAVLSYYRTHRALIRAKVLLERALQDGVPGADRAALRAAAESYLWFGRGAGPAVRPAILVMHGLSGSGKSVFSSNLVRLLGAVRIRSDVERRRLFSGAAQRYSGAATRRTYARLARLARTVVLSGWPVIVDAAFLQAWQRKLLRGLAAELSVPFFLFDLQAPLHCIRQRLEARQMAGGDASEAGPGILAGQLLRRDVLTPEEQAQVLMVDTTAGLDLAQVRAVCAPVLARCDLANDCSGM